MKVIYTLFFLILPFVGISQAKSSLFGIDESNTTVATRDSSKTIGLSLDNESLSYIINNKPENFIVTLPLFGEDVDLLLKINNTFFKNIIIESSGENGRENLNISPTIISYEIQFENLSIGVLNFYNGTISSTFNIKNTQYEISEYNNQYLLFEVNNSINNSGFSCAVESQLNNIGYSPVDSDNSVLNSIGCIEFAIDIDYYTRQTFSSDLEATNWALAIFAGVAQLYQAQSNFSVVVDYLNIWNITDPYAAYVQDAGGMLDSFGDHWNANFTDIPRDLTHLLTKRSNTGTGGIAWIDVLCNTNYRYGFSSNLTDDTTYTFPNPTYTWNLNVCAHEIGHNIGSNHTHDCNWTADASLGFSGGGIDNCGVLSGSGSDCNPPAPYPTDGIGTIMSYCHVGGSGISLEFNDIILSQGLVPFLESASCLHECGGCTDPLAMNYDPNAEIDDGSCDFDFVYGCDDPTACNYVDTAEVNDGSCIYAMEGFDCDSLCLGQNEETYVLTLFDSYGDGWYGGTGQHTLLINGISYGTEFTNGSTANTGLIEANYYLCIDEDICNEVSFINGGSWESECSFTISNSSDDILIYGDYNTSNETFGDACGNSALTYVPDDNFEQALIDLGYDNVLDDYVLTENINELTGLYINNKNIADLTGIEDFTALNYLSCGINQLTTLDLSSNTQLETLYASSNQLTSIDVSNSINLYQLDVSVSQLTDIDISNNPNLAYLNCGGNLLTNLDVSNNTNLVEIQCGNNSILALELSNNVNLSSVNCGFNEITSLDFSNNPDLTYINCRANELTFLNVTNNTLLNELNFSSNQLLNIDLTNNLLLEVVKGIYNNDLQTIDVSNNDSLKVLLLYACDLISINLSNNLLLTEVNLNGNQLTYLDLSNNSNLIDLVVSVNYNLTFLDIRNGNNINMSLNATATTLTCINVDDTEWATENWTNNNGSIDAQVSFSEDCQNLTYVPDDNFEQALIDFGYDNVLDDYVLTENILDITYLNVSTKGISDLTGIEDFESLEILYCFENNLSSLDISSNSNLITLYCYNNQISNIDISQNQNLESFDIGNNNLNSIDVSNNTSLTLLHCYNNQLSSIDVSQNTLLINLYCWGNQISNLDISQNLELTRLQCYDNLLSILDISLNTELEDLYCSSNQLSSININNNIDLVRLRCGINQLSSLDVSNNLDLEIIYCSDNAITELDVSTNSFLSEFYCSVNELTKLDVSNNTNLTILNCSNNDLDSLNLKNGNNTQMVLTTSSNPDLFCITVDDTDWSNANWTVDNQSINIWNSFSEDCELGFVTFGCTDSNSCNFQPTANTDDESCIYLVSSYDTVVSCDSYFWNDSMYYQSGNYNINNSSTEGCDSIANLNLTILQSDSIFNDTTVCDEFIWAEDTIISSGNYFFAYTNSNGCDSIHYFDVTVNPSSEAIDEKFTCEDSFLWFDNNTYFEDNFTAQYIIANEYNCPLTITLNLTFLENPTSQTIVEECESYTWNGSTYNTSGQYTYTTTADNGCDSTATLDLTINDSQFSTDVQFDCNEFTWTDGITYTESNNSATVTLTANNGCDSIVTLNLTIYESDTTFSSITACDEFIWNNISYTQSGFYTNTFENTNGCDSTHTYDLTILESTFGADTQVQCDEYTWIDGNTYTQSTNSPTFTLTNSLGCDSTVTLNLTINLSDTSFTDVTACESFEWNGETYTESGTYTQSISSNNEFSMNFDGDDDYLFIEHSNSLDIGEGSISYEMWFKKSAVTFFSQTNLATNYINQTTPLIGLYVGGTNEGVNEGKLNFSYRTSQAASEVNLKSDFRVDDDIWHHVVGVKNTTTDSIYLYIDGELVNQTNILSGNTDTYQGYVLGGNHLNRFMNVDIDAFRIWSTALSQQKIQQYMNCPPSGNEEDLIGYWNFEEGEGNTVYDLTSNNNNGIINGATYSNDVPEQSCQLTAVNGCDSVAVLNLTITQPDTSITEVTACESYEWNGETYTESGTYTQSVSLNNEFSMNFGSVNDYMGFTYRPIPEPWNEGTISTWVKFNGSNWGSGGDWIFNGYTSNTDYIGLGLHTTANFNNQFLRFGFYVDGNWEFATSNIIPVVGQWYYIVGTWGTNGLNIYVNGVLSGSNEYSGPSPYSDGFTLGSTNNNSIIGDISSLGVWNIALDTSQIQQYMYCQPNSNEEILHSYWNFEEGQGITTNDQTLTGNNGTFVNDAGWSNSSPLNNCQLTTINGCDSITVLNLTITQPDTSFAEITACDSYDWNGVTLTESGTYFYPESQNLQTIDGFSYMGQLDNSLYYISENLSDWNDASAACIAAGGHLVSINSEEENNFIGTNLTNNSIWTGLYQASDNSAWQLTDGSDPTYFNWRSDQPGGSNQNCVDFYYDASVAGSVFENQYNVWTDANCNDNYYYILEIPSNELTTINGCDSVAVIDLTINESTFGIDTQVHCDEYTWIDGNTYTESTNSPTFTLTNSLDCDSIVILDLSILESTSSFTSASACESYLWNDSLYTESGLKVFNTTNSVGCDSIARLFLTINEPTFATDTQVHCDEFTWIDGISYTESNDSATHTITGGNSNGCDSIVTLNLTIYNSDNTFGDTTACDEFVWNGISYTESGIFSNTFENSNGCDSTHTIDITILESTFGVDTQIHCDEYTWIDGNTYTESTNSPSFILTNSLGCDSIVILDLSILESTSSFTSASACESYLWNDSLYTESGLKVFNTTNSVGCDSIARLFLTINEPTFATDIQVHCDEFTWIDGISYTESNDSATHTITGGNSNGCDSIVTLNLTIYNSDNTFGDTTACNEFVWNGISYTESGIFSNTFENSNGCDSTHTIDITILESTFGVDTQIHCDNYTWINGITYTESTSSPTYALTNSVGCDSVVTLNLSILESDSTFISETHCDQLVWDDSTYTISGIYTNYYTNVEGCDSSHTINLSIYYSDSSFDQITACDEFVWEDSVYTESGIYTNTYTNANGCDSTNTLGLTILNSSSGTDTQVHCDNYTWINGITYTESTSSPTYALTNSVGCDSVVTLNLSILESDSTFISETHCDQLVWDDSTYTISGIYTNYYTNVEGCDSSHTINLSIYYSDSSFDQITACDEFVWEDSVYTESGIYTNTYTNANGCDSTNTLGLTILNSSSGTDTQVHCDNYTWINGITYTESTSSPTYALTNSVGCDSVVTLNLSILESDSTFISETHCDQLVWDDSTYTISGIYTNYYTNVEGCDSSHTINLSIYYSDSSFAQITACDEFVWEDSVYTESGIYTNSYTNANGCDSTNTLDLTILNSSSGTDTQVHCDNYTWIDGITYTESTSSPTYALTNSVGCDSVVTLNLSILESDSTFISETHCDQLVWDDSTYTISGIYTNYYTNVEGCDSSHTINLSIYYSDSSFAQITACDEFLWEDSVYTESGIYTNSYINSNGCDSTNTLDLTILNSSSGTDTQVHCDNYTWIDGITYTESTSSPTYALTNSVGCDSVVTLNLSILESDSTFISETHCDQLVWDDSTYTISGIYTNYYTNVEGCDSSHTINLSIYYSDSSFAQITACDEFLWEDSVYTESGIYTNSYINSNGCDSTHTINLTILNSNNGTDVEEHCDEFTWIDGITYTESTSSPTYTLTNSVGCDSLVTLNLTIYNSYNLDTNITSCDAFVWDDSTYIESGVYTNNYTSINGCDSVYTINLSLLETTYGIDSIVSCDEYTWIDGISYTENTNSPTFTLTNSVGCDSVVNLNLTILESTETNTSIVACDNFEWYGTTYYQSGTYYNYSINSIGCDLIEVLELTIEYCGCIDPVADNFNPNATLDDGSCVYCESFSIIITASSDVSEFGGNDGYVFASGIGGSAQYSLNVFDENFIPQNPFGLTAGIYTVAVFDAVTGCVAETLFTIYEPTVYFNCTNLGCVESSVIDDSYYTLEECEANCSSVTVSPCDSVPNGLFVDNVIDNRIRFNWSPTEVAPSHYMIRYRELGTNSWTVITAGPVNTQAYYGTSRTRYFMEPATTYEWSIRARVLNDDLSIDCQSAWSATSEYTTLPACANLENLSVFTEANWVTFFADAPSEEWGVWQSKGKIREFGSTSYRYVNGDDNGNINSLKGNFTESTNYEWHTKAWCTANVDEDGNSDPMYHSGWGEFSNFTTEDPCDKMPINLSTSSNGANTAVIMSWDTPLSGNPDHYFLEMTNITSGDVYEWNNIPGTDNSKTKFNQSTGDEISWKIRGACGTNGTSFATPFSSTVYYVLGGEKLSNVQNLLVYPNPSRNEFNISFDISERQIVDVKVVNSIGQEVYENSLEIKGTFDTKIDLSGYSKGVYNLSIETTDGIKNHKLILQ